MKMRVLGTTVPETSTPPLSHSGVRTHCRRAEDVPGQLLQDQADAEGDQQRVQWSVVHVLDEGHLQQHADEPADEESDDQRGDQSNPVLEMRYSCTE